MNNQSAYVDESLPLLSFDSSGKISVNEQAIRILSEVPKPIAVLGIAGSYRSGKSFFLNRVLLNRKKGFLVGNQILPCTKGIWMWGRPLPGVSASGEPVNIIVIDSEGLSAIDTELSHDSKVYCLSILLSSVFIYNHIGAIDEDSIQNLSYISTLCSKIQLKTNQDDVTFQDYQSFMPSFYWIL